MKLLAKKIGMVAASVALSIFSFSSFACGDAYRTYYLNKSCQYYTVDADGTVVKGGKYNSWQMKNFPLHRDMDGRYYRVDAWGNKVYVVKRCHMVRGEHCHHWKN